MKRILFLALLLVALATTAHASLLKLDGTNELPATEVQCGQADSMVISLDPSWSTANIVTVTIKGVGNLSVSGSYWRKSECIIPSNGNLSVRVNKVNIVQLLTLSFCLCFLFFLAFFFLRLADWAEKLFIGLLAGVFLFPLMIFLQEESIPDSDHLIFFSPWLLFTGIWFFVFYLKTLTRKHYLKFPYSWRMRLDLK